MVIKFKPNQLVPFWTMQNNIHCTMTVFLQAVLTLAQPLLSKDSTRSMLEILLFCAIFVGSHCEDYGKSECPSIFKPLDPECGEDNLQAQANPAVLTGPIYKDAKQGYLRSCVWTITARDGHSIALNFIKIELNNGLRCWPNYLKVYSGKDYKDSQHEVFSACSKNDSRRVETGWKQVTVVFQVYDHFLHSKIEFQYADYPTESFSPNVAASFNTFPSTFSSPSCKKPEDFGAVNSTFTFRWDREDDPEILVYYCVDEGVNLTHFWLTADSPVSASSWHIDCNHTACRIYDFKLGPPPSGHYKFYVRVRQLSASVTFEVITEPAPQIRMYATSPYLRGRSYQFDCDIQGEPVSEAYWFFHSTERVDQCVTEQVPFFSEGYIPRTEAFNQSKELADSKEKLHYVCNENIYRLRLFLTAEESGCLVCWTRNRFRSKLVIEAVPVAGPSGEFFITSSEEESVEGEMFSLTCTADSFVFNNLVWSFQRVQYGAAISQYQLKERDVLITIEGNRTSGTISSILHFERLTAVHDGYYTCTGDKTLLKHMHADFRYHFPILENHKIKLQKNLKKFRFL